MIVIFAINGEPYGKGRPRFRKDGHAYTPKKTKDYEHFVKTEYDIQCGNMKLEGPLEAYIKAVFSVPKSDNKTTRAKKLSGEIPVTKKPDCDNIAKTILDALNGVAYHDDSQVVNLEVTKVYGDPARVEVMLRHI